MSTRQADPGRDRFMGMALEMARRAAGRTAPNPMVGAVIVVDGQVVAEGHTRPPGQDHAEVDALRRVPAGVDLRQATMYVTFEPCCHHGRTPPCTDAILKSGLGAVVVGTIDPFPLVAGRGIRILQEAGLQVAVGVRERECRRQNLGFIRAIRHGLPTVTVKAAQSLDGRIAAADGGARWVTGPAAREVGHQLRDQHDAILVGIRTVLADDPALTTRSPGGRDAAVAVLDSQLRIPENAKLFEANRPVFLFCSASAPERALPAPVFRVPDAPRGLDLDAVLRVLVAAGQHRVLAEGGGEVHRSLLAGAYVDQMELFVSPRVLAGGAPVVGGPGFSLAGAPSFRLRAAVPLGDDLHLSLESTRDEILLDPVLYEPGAVDVHRAG